MSPAPHPRCHFPAAAARRRNVGPAVR